ncbi:hypothetical protein ACHAWC_001018, partial [Mediolabrus comicus]
MNATTLRYFVGRSARTHNLASQTSFSSSSALLANYYSVTTGSFSAPTQAAPDIRLYQYHICPFCNISKSLLAYAKLDYDKVEVNPLTKQELKPLSADYRKVPIAIIDEEQINGSDKIIDTLLNLPYVQQYLQRRWNEEEQRQKNGDENATTAMTMQQFHNSENSQKWMKYASDDLAALLYPNICGTLGDSYDAFRYVHDVDSFTTGQRMSIQLLGSLAMYFAASKVKSKRNITDEKKALQEALDRFEQEGLENGKLSFCSGLSTPNLGDLAVFGVLYAVNGLNAHTESIQLRGGPVKE